MNLLAIGVIGGAVAAVALAVGAFRIGQKYEQGEEAGRRAVMLDRVVKVVEYREREVPVIVERVVRTEVKVEKEVERVITVANSMLAPDCVLPDDFGLLLVAAANGTDPDAAGSADAFAGAYDCRAALAAILSDLRAGWRNTARLEGLQAWAKLVSEVPK